MWRCRAGLNFRQGTRFVRYAYMQFAVRTLILFARSQDLSTGKADSMRQNAETARLTAQTKMTPTWDAPNRRCDPGQHRRTRPLAVARRLCQRTCDDRPRRRGRQAPRPDERIAAERGHRSRSSPCWSPSQMPSSSRSAPRSGGLWPAFAVSPDANAVATAVSMSAIGPARGGFVRCVRKIGRPGATPSCDSCTLCVHNIRTSDAVRGYTLRV